MAGDMRLSVAEKKWSTEAVKRCDGNPSVKKIRELGLDKEHNKKFERKITDTGLYSRLRSLAIKMGTISSTPKGKNKIEKVLEKSPFLVYVKGSGIFGYDTEKEVKDFIINSGILGNISVFKRAKVDIKYDLKIS